MYIYANQQQKPNSIYRVVITHNMLVVNKI